MQFSAKLKFLPISPYKLRPFIDVVRGKNAQTAISWLSTQAVKRAVPIKKMIESAVANAKDLKNINAHELAIADIRVDQGPIFKYYKPGAMGRSNPYRKRFSHASVILKSFADIENENVAAVRPVTRKGN